MAQHAITNGVVIRIASIETMDTFADVLRSGTVLPIGSVEFIRAAFGAADIPEPVNISYPAALHRYLHRKVEQRSAGSVLGRHFVKPVATKAFTGFVFDTMEDPLSLSEHDQEQHAAFIAMPADAPVWVSEEVTWQSEYRCYFLDGRLVGCARYDDGPNSAPAPDWDVAREIHIEFHNSGEAPVAYAIDVGVLSTGETALVECNDAWALGYYKDTGPNALTPSNYIEMLLARWKQLFKGSVPAQ